MAARQRKPDLSALRRKWYERLRAKGFIDIEHESGKLRLSDGAYIRDIACGDPAVYLARVDYYYYAEHFLHVTSFSSPLVKEIWSEHVKGKSARRIARELRERMGHMNKDNVSAVIRDLKSQLSLYIQRLAYD